MIQKIEEDVLLYTTDTDKGMSGSPLFDMDWNLIGIHHSAGESKGLSAKISGYKSNEGIR